MTKRELLKELNKNVSGELSEERTKEISNNSFLKNLHEIARKNCIGLRFEDHPGRKGKS